MPSKFDLRPALALPYDRPAFVRDVLRPVFGPQRLTLFGTAQPVDGLSAADRKLARAAVQYGSLRLDDGTDVRCLEVHLHPQVRPEQSRVGIQALVRRLLLTGQAGLVSFVPAEAAAQPWRFTLVAKEAVLRDGAVAEHATHARRYTYLLGPGQACRTPAERLQKLATEIGLDLATLVRAFEVEVLSKEFFKEYKRHYALFCDELTGSNFRRSVFNADDKAIRDFVKKLLGRLVFLYFVQKKGWLGASDTRYADGNPDFLSHLFRASGADATFYPVWLSRLFFDTLNQPDRPGDGFPLPDGRRVCIPFLNGGLFDRDAHDSALLTLAPGLFQQPPALADDPARRGFLDFLDAYNFTVQEDAPDDHIVAVDPEMLGNIFENLLEDNKDKGAFYTPKEIVHYMCRESLIEYLDTRLNVAQVPLGHGPGRGLAPAPAPAPGTGQLRITETVNRGNLQRAELESFVRDKLPNAFIRRHAQQIDQLLDTVKICDPAIGSGAFPMGLLHEIYACKLALKDLVPAQLGTLFHERDHLPDPGAYHAAIKLGIIQNSIYGVDIERGAVDIARLRFWLSLVVDEARPRPLPNLDYKIVVGNSLVSKLGADTLALNWHLKAGTDREAALRRQYQALGALQATFFTQSGRQKAALQAQIRNAKLDLLLAQVELEMAKLPPPQTTMFGGTARQQAAETATAARRQGYQAQLRRLQTLRADAALPLDYFDWRLDFPEVLNPHVTDEPGFDIVIGNPPYGLKEKGKEYLEFVAQNYAPARKVADSYFLFMVLAAGIAKGESFISYIVPNTFCDLEQGDEFRKWFFGQNRLSHLFDTQWAFEKAVVDTVVFISQTKTLSSDSTQIRFTANDKTQSILPLNSVLSSKSYKLVYRYSEVGNKGLVEKLLSECEQFRKHITIKAGVKLYEKGKGNPPQDDAILAAKPFTKKMMPAKGWKMLLRGADINKYTIKKTDEVVNYGAWLAAPRTPETFLGPYIIIRRTDDNIKAAFIEKEAVCVNSCHVLKPHDPKQIYVMLAVLNSKLLQWIFEVQNPQMVGKVFAEIKVVYVENLPCKEASAAQLDTFNSRVAQILAAKAVSPLADTTALEAEIDVLVYRLYGLSHAEVLLVEPGFGLSAAAYAAAGPA